MKIITVIGARPQFIKAAVVSRAIRQLALQGTDIQEYILHTGQHYDYAMSELFFSQLDIPAPTWHLDCGNDIQRMKSLICPILEAERPDLVLVYGDTNSTLAGAESAQAMNIPVAHIEAGLRSFDNSMPEERNRIATDRIASWLFCPTRTAVMNLQREGFTRHVYHTGDVMYDATLLFTPDEQTQQHILKRHQVASKQFAITTIHRAATAENIEALSAIIQALRQTDIPVLWPLHPHTGKTVQSSEKLQTLLAQADNIRVMDPVGYVEMLALERHARYILTDSGGMQKEAYFQQSPCITLRNETEWTETVQAGWNRLAGTTTQGILDALRQPFRPQVIRDFGDGQSAQTILQLLCQNAS